jgi:hypothetical protein
MINGWIGNGNFTALTLQNKGTYFGGAIILPGVPSYVSQTNHDIHLIKQANFTLPQNNPSQSKIQVLSLHWQRQIPFLKLLKRDVAASHESKPPSLTTASDSDRRARHRGRQNRSPGHLTSQVHPTLLGEGQGPLVLQDLQPVPDPPQAHLDHIGGGLPHGHG